MGLTPHKVGVEEFEVAEPRNSLETELKQLG
jgi:hypothetical protein